MKKMSPKKFNIYERLHNNKSELMIYIRSRVLDVETTEIIASAVTRRAYQEINESIGENYFYTWLKEMAKSEIFYLQVKEIEPTLKIHARSKVFNHQEAEDLISKTLLKAYENLDNFDGTNLLAWTKVIMNNIFIDDNLRRQTFSHEERNRQTNQTETVYRQRIEQLSESTPELSSKGDQIDSVHKDQLLKCLEELKAENREILMMKQKGYKYKELAEKFDKSVSNLKQINLRCIESLSHCMGV
ncbi:RNA polymerase sigma factor [Gammaproteobacteria bacterium]|nr:RNA polymerase sigma factor [Gammaproteobacteria bacterium]